MIFQQNLFDDYEQEIFYRIHREDFGEPKNIRQQEDILFQNHLQNLLHQYRILRSLQLLLERPSKNHRVFIQQLFEEKRRFREHCKKLQNFLETAVPDVTSYNQETFLE